MNTVMVVDDTPENVSLLVALLSSAYTIVTAANGNAALKLIRENPPDLILLDVMMPEMDGFEVCRILKADEVTKGIPVIFVTALSDVGNELDGFNAGGVDYITKPFVNVVVRSRVKAYLALSEAQKYMEDWNGSLRKRLLQSVKIIRLEGEEHKIAAEMNSDSYRNLQNVKILSALFKTMNNHFGTYSQAVCDLAGEAARNMKLSRNEVAEIKLAALLHDTGLLVSGRASPEKNVSEMSANELKEYNEHPERGQELVAACDTLHTVGLMVRNHHENYDGNGFPDGLSRDEIPLGARLLAIADSIVSAADSVSEERDEYALTALRSQAGTRLDPRLIAYFTTIIHSRYFKTNKGKSSGEVEVSSSELISGMRLSRDISSPTGVLLLQKGDTLDSARITLIRRLRQGKKQLDNGVWMYIDNDVTTKF